MIDIVPHFKEHDRHAPDRLSFQTDSGVLPVAKSRCLVNIFVRKVDSSGKSNFSVDNKDFPVISVIHHNRHDRTEWIKCCAFDSFFLKLLIILRWKRIDAANIIIDQSDIHTLFAFAFQHIYDAVEHSSLIYNEIFQKNKMLCLF